MPRTHSVFTGSSFDLGTVAPHLLLSHGARASHVLGPSREELATQLYGPYGAAEPKRAKFT